MRGINPLKIRSLLTELLKNCNNRLLSGLTKSVRRTVYPFPCEPQSVGRTCHWGRTSPGLLTISSVVSN